MPHTPTQWIDITAGADSYPGYLALPPTGRGPGILIVQEIFGVNEHIRSVAQQYALDGYVALAPDLFWRTQPRVELGYTDVDRAQGFALMQKTDLQQATEDLAAAAQTLRARPEVIGKVASIGYCFGGQMSYRLAARGAVDAAVAYYGGGIENALELAERVRAPILFHYGARDSSIPLDAIERVKQRFAGRNNAQFHIYHDAAHGFNCWARASYNQRAAALARGRTLIFLSENLSTY